MKREALFYEMIFKRKSFHIFKETGKIASEELIITGDLADQIGGDAAQDLPRPSA